MIQHFFLIELKDGTSNIIFFEQGNTELYFRTIYNCITDPKNKSYKLITGTEVTNEDTEQVLKCCERFLGLD
ncbi:hypothetical protein [Flavobacterium psychrophilum]|uniref:hypothetical protein n=1 Tax=Flavobacterium psychrophilum TaxID=96345 RepID=UPI000B7C5050|nr:hypothetical protein [Flavobacterium psychrophilum]EKT4502361.1 hypothetical protein [Flavobacterium psychrophilum]SNB35519.1 hypothetical protein NO042_600005 [Flavobacterium psychrophilum]